MSFVAVEHAAELTCGWAHGRPFARGDPSRSVFVEDKEELAILTDS